MPLSKIFGTRLKQARMNKGLNQSEVARLMGETYLGNISMWELGKTFPGLDKVEKLAELMEVQPYWFFQPDSLTKSQGTPRSLNFPTRQVDIVLDDCANF